MYHNFLVPQNHLIIEYINHRHFKVSFDVNQFLTTAETADFISDVTTARIQDEKYMDSKNIVSNPTIGTFMHTLMKKKAMIVRVRFYPYYNL